MGSASLAGVSPLNYYVSVANNDNQQRKCSAMLNEKEPRSQNVIKDYSSLNETGWLKPVSYLVAFPRKMYINGLEK